MVNRGQQPIFVDTKLFSNEFPGKGDRVFFEIIAKGEVPEHFKEGMVTRCIAHIVEIIVLPTSAYTFLRCCGALIVAGLNAGKQVLKLHHA